MEYIDFDKEEKDKKKSDLLEFFNNDSVDNKTYNQIKSMISDEFVCEEKKIYLNSMYTKWKLHKIKDKKIIDELKEFKTKNNLIGNQLMFNSYFDYCFVRTIYTLN